MLAGCAMSVESQWEEARRADSVAGYRAFVEEHPGHTYASLAEKRIEELAFERFKRLIDEEMGGTGNHSVHDIENAYIGRYPKGRFIEQAQRLLDPVVYARTPNDVASLEGYLSRFPNGIDAEDAHRRIQALLIDNDADKSAERIREYRQKYNNRELSEETRSWLEQYDLAQTKGFLAFESRYEFLAKYSGSDNYQVVDDLLYKELLLADRSEYYREYLDRVGQSLPAHRAEYVRMRLSRTLAQETISGVLSQAWSIENTPMTFSTFVPKDGRFELGTMRRITKPTTEQGTYTGESLEYDLDFRVLDPKASIETVRNLFDGSTNYRVTLRKRDGSRTIRVKRETGSIFTGTVEHHSVTDRVQLLLYHERDARRFVDAWSDFIRTFEPQAPKPH